MFLLCTLDNSRNEDTGQERSKKDKESSTIGRKEFVVNIQQRRRKEMLSMTFLKKYSSVT
jgi:hypothetical protein